MKTFVVVRKEWLHACGYRTAHDDAVMAVTNELGRLPSGCMMYEVYNPFSKAFWVVAEWRLRVCQVNA